MIFGILAIEISPCWSTRYTTVVSTRLAVAETVFSSSQPSGCQFFHCHPWSSPAFPEETREVTALTNHTAVQTPQDRCSIHLRAGVYQEKMRRRDGATQRYVQRS
ncbi:hypothetical protein Pcinc_024028 [Petrolisthes cinctipes]|uniref:Uncharacterized protein n=1 Tax=Petrolisthes cinctipes TaxID=88211 RepID=A0AAE1FCC7_PETCI|nr:hypothetical protein Pcinc_024028 [Petrolisthes cinctipes]